MGPTRDCSELRPPLLPLVVIGGRLLLEDPLVARIEAVVQLNLLALCVDPVKTAGLDVVVDDLQSLLTVLSGPVRQSNQLG